MANPISEILLGHNPKRTPIFQSKNTKYCGDNKELCALFEGKYWIGSSIEPYFSNSWSYRGSDSSANMANENLNKALLNIEAHVIGVTSYNLVNTLGHCLAMKYGMLLYKTASNWEANNNKSVGVGLNSILYKRDNRASYFYDGELRDKDDFIKRIRAKHQKTYSRYSGFLDSL